MNRKKTLISILFATMMLSITVMPAIALQYRVIIVFKDTMDEPVPNYYVYLLWSQGNGNNIISDTVQAKKNGKAIIDLDEDFIIGTYQIRMSTDGTNFYPYSSLTLDDHHSARKVALYPYPTV